MRKATNADVSEIEVEVERPVDRASKLDELVGDVATTSVSGSGATGVLVENQSDGKWYLEAVSTHALGASPGTVQVVVQVRDGNGNVISRLVSDGASGGPLPFQGVTVRPGYDVYYEILQSDSSSYDITMTPVFRKPDPTRSGSGGGAGRQDMTLDSFGDSDLSEYTGDTAEFSVNSDNAFYNNNSVVYDSETTETFHTIISTPGDGFANYLPDPPYTVRCRVASEVGDGDQQTTDRVAFLWGTQDGNNTLRTEYAPAANDFFVVDTELGNPRTLERDPFAVNGGYTAGDWLILETTHRPNSEPSIVAKLKDDTGTLQSTVSGDAEAYGDGFGFVSAKTSADQDHYMDYVTVEPLEED